MFGEAGAVVGGAVGTFFPVVGNIAGTMVGGAVGTAAGGFICAFGYDKYVKDYVAKGVLAGIAAVIDPLPMAEMRAKMDALMLQKMSPEERAMLEASSTFGGGEVQLLDFGTLPSVPTLKQPASSVPTLDAQQQAILTNDLAGITSFELRLTTTVDHPIACTIAAGQVSCAAAHVLPPGHMSYSLKGGVNGNVLDLESFNVFVSSVDGCLNRVEYRGTIRSHSKKVDALSLVDPLRLRERLRAAARKDHLPSLTTMTSLALGG